ncbi:MAG TPA: hypothetical protein VMN58_06900 [Acidimicrobiales bacterium]|nr:hypothetical protein [Acidimicrobiales bacterium]
MAGPDLGTDQRRLRRASVLAGLGDGTAATALPLLAAGITRDPLAVAGVIAAQHLPWVLTAALGPLLLRSVDRRTTMGAVDTMRAVALGVLGFVVLTNDETILLVQVAAFVVGLGEILTDDGESAGADSLGGGLVGGRLSAAGMWAVGVGMVAGGLLYEVISAAPLLLDVGVFSLAALSALSVSRTIPSRTDDGATTPSGVRPARDSTAVTAVAVLAAAATSAVIGVLVLFALDDLGLGAPAFGLLLAGLAVAATAGGLIAPEVGRLLGVRAGLVAGLLTVGAGHAAASLLADPLRPEPAVVGLGVAAGGAMVAVVLSRVLLFAGTGRGIDGPGLQAFHLAVWTAVPAGALAGGWAGRHVDTAGVVLGAGVAALLAAGLVVTVRKPGAPTGGSPARAAPDTVAR